MESIAPKMKNSNEKSHVNPEVERANAAVKKKIRRIWIMIGLSVLGVAAMITFIVAFPRLFRDQRFVTMDLMTIDGKALIVSLWSEEFSSEDDGTVLRGYEVRAYDPESRTELSKIFMEHRVESMPSNPQLHLGPNGDVWVVQSQDNGQSSSFLQRLKVSSAGQFELVPTAAIKDYVPISGFRGTKLSLRNKFNEFGCFDAETNKLVEQNCPWENAKPAKGSFFLVTKTNGSTRSKLWHVQSDSVPPEPGISVGYVTGDRPIDGVFVLNDLASNRYTVTEERLGYYQISPEAPQLHLKCLTNEDYLVDARLIYQDSLQAILQMPTEDPKIFEVVCMDGFGQRVWKVKVDFGDNPYSSLEIKSLPGKAVLMIPEVFALAVNLDEGGIAWEYRP
jgi:hypothetical protein